MSQLAPLKEIAKKSRVLYWLNAKTKCYELKRELAVLARRYAKKAAVSQFSYDPEEAKREFKRRHREHQPAFMPREPGKLRVLWAGMNQNQDESGFIQSLQRMCNVTVLHRADGSYGLLNCDPSDRQAVMRTRNANEKTLLEQVAQAMNRGGLDLLLGQMWAHLISNEALCKIQGMHIPVINISMDDRLPIHWADKHGIRLGSVGLAPGLDMVLTTSPETCSWYGVERCPALFWPLASDPGIFASAGDEARDIDVLFIGNKYGVRGQIVQYIENRGVSVACYGHGWSNGYATAEQMSELSKRARIALGVGTVGHCADVYTLKLRDFDAPMSGALYLTHRNPDLCRLYREGQEIECYKTSKEAFEKVRFYLDHPAQLDRVAKNGQRAAMSRHTWDKRLSTMFEQLGLMQATQPAVLDRSAHL